MPRLSSIILGGLNNFIKMLNTYSKKKKKKKKISLILKVSSVHIFYSMCKKACFIFKYKIT